MKILHRSLIVSRIIFKNIDPVILIGLGIGLLGGLGLAIEEIFSVHISWTATDPSFNTH